MTEAGGNQAEAELEDGEHESRDCANNTGSATSLTGSHHDFSLSMSLTLITIPILCGKPDHTVTLTF